MNREPMKIGLLEHFGTGNLGDDATVGAVLQQIRRRWPDGSIVGLSLNPSDTEKRHGIPSFPIRRVILTADWWSPAGESSPDGQEPTADRSSFKIKLKSALRRLNLLRLAVPIVNLYREFVFLGRSFRIARSLDLLVIGGGGQLLDTWGPWGFPYTLFKWVLLAKLSGARCYFVNVGAGPLNHTLGKWLVRRALGLADYVSFRDHKSRALIEQIGLTGGAPVVADNVYGLEVPAPVARAGQTHAGNELIVAISPMAYCDPRRFWDKDQSIYDGYIQKLADFGARLVQGHHRLRLFSSDIWFDSQAILDLDAAIKKQLDADAASWVTCDSVSSIEEFLSRLSEVDCVVTSRFHGVVFGNLLNVPVLAIAHHPKVSTEMQAFGTCGVLPGY